MPHEPSSGPQIKFLDPCAHNVCPVLGFGALTVLNGRMAKKIHSQAHQANQGKKSQFGADWSIEQVKFASCLPVTAAEQIMARKKFLRHGAQTHASVLR